MKPERENKWNSLWIFSLSTARLEERMEEKKFSRLFLIVLISFLFVSYALAQAGRGKGRINGVVVDKDGNSIKSATIVIEFAENREFKQETTADENGEWAFIGLGTGTWRVTASADGYISTYQDIYIRQLERNPKMTLTLKKIQPADDGMIKDESSLSLLEEANNISRPPWNKQNSFCHRNCQKNWKQQSKTHSIPPFL